MILEDISLRASTFSFDNLERRVLKTGDFFQLQIEVSGGRVEWFKDGVLVPKNEFLKNHPLCPLCQKAVTADVQVFRDMPESN